MEDTPYSTFAIVAIVLVVVIGGSVLFWWSPPSAEAPVVPNTPTNTQKTYTNPAFHYSISYPENFTLNPQYSYTVLGPERAIAGVSFTIPVSLTSGTNLSADSYISVEPLTGAINSCSAEIYLDSPAYLGFVDEGGHRYSIASASGAGAGNRYEETVYATPVTGGCLAVRYFIHLTAVANYPAGTVQEFDKASLIAKFDTIRRSLSITQ